MIDVTDFVEVPHHYAKEIKELVEAIKWKEKQQDFYNMKFQVGIIKPQELRDFKTVNFERVEKMFELIKLCRPYLKEDVYEGELENCNKDLDLAYMNKSTISRLLKGLRK